MIVLFLYRKREDLAGVLFEDLGEVSLYDPLFAEISCVLYVCMCGYSYSLSRVYMKKKSGCDKKNVFVV